MNVLTAQSLPVPFLAVSNPPDEKRLERQVHLFVLTSIVRPPGRRAARMSLCNRFSASPTAFVGGAYVKHFERTDDTCARCWGYLKTYLLRNDDATQRRAR